MINFKVEAASDSRRFKASRSESLGRWKHLFTVRTVQDKIVQSGVRFPRRRTRASMTLARERFSGSDARFAVERFYERQCYDAEHRLCTERT